MLGLMVMKELKLTSLSKNERPFGRIQRHHQLLEVHGKVHGVIKTHLEGKPGYYN